MSLSAIQPVTGFDLVNSYVEVVPFNGQSIEPVKMNQSGWLITTSDFFSRGGGATFKETGYLQTFFRGSPESVGQTVQNPDPGYTFLADDGFRDPDTGQIQGDDTHYMFFDVAPGVPLDAPVYTNFADQDSRGFYPAGGPQVDSITALLASGGPGQTITDGIASATVPEPAGAIVFLASGLLSCSAGGVDRRHRRGEPCVRPSAASTNTAGGRRQASPLHQRHGQTSLPMPPGDH